jgi:hypothetical protein
LNQLKAKPNSNTRVGSVSRDVRGIIKIEVPNAFISYATLHVSHTFALHIGGVSKGVFPAARRLLGMLAAVAAATVYLQQHVPQVP